MEGKIFSYESFGLSIISQIPLPELNQYYPNQPTYDVAIQLEELSLLDQSEKQAGFYVKDNQVMFEVPDTAIFCIKNGKKIIVSPKNGYEMDKLRLYILGTCMGIILMQKNILALHGSAVVKDGKAYAFIGESGAGKSTLASAFLKEGYQLLSDDVIRIFLTKEGTPFIAPSYPQQKLWQESLVEFGMEHSNYKPLFERETKFAIPVHDNFCSTPFPLSAVFELVKTVDDKISINQILNLERFRVFFTHTYRSSLIPRLGLIQWHFSESAAILKNIDLFQIKRPENRFTAKELVAKIQSEIKKSESGLFRGDQLKVSWGEGAL